MKYLKRAQTLEEFDELKQTAKQLPLVAICKVEGQKTYYISNATLNYAINDIAGEDIIGIQTVETDIDKQVDEILG